MSSADLDYWTIIPTGWLGGGTAPSLLPVVVFNHGWLGYDPVHYDDWLRHLARKGNVVIFPKYQNLFTPGQYFSSNAIWSTRRALDQAFKSSAVKPDRARGMTLIGHSAGGRISLDMAHKAAAEGLPTPEAVLAVEPADSSALMPLAANYSGIPSSTKVVCLVGDADTVVGRGGCDLTWDRIGHVPAANKSYLWQYGDSHGTPALVADHGAPSETDPVSNPVDALDWYGMWKIADALRDCGTFGTSCAYALGGTAQQVDMGRWSGGVPVRKMTASTTKPPCPAGTTAKWC